LIVGAFYGVKHTMQIAPRIETGLQRLADLFFARRPQPFPSLEKLVSGRIISHRGEHDNAAVMENTLEAFDRAAAAGVWGIELDVRWTADMEPVVIHDPDLSRLYGCGLAIHETSLADLSARFPTIPCLADVVQRYGGSLHLMIELKWTPQKVEARCQYRKLRDVLRTLEPLRDYHLMSLHPEAFEHLNGFPRQALVAIATYRPGPLSRMVIDNQWGGLCTHYLLMPKGLINLHKKNKQTVGVGYCKSRNSLFRELNRGVDWIFSNHAAAIQAVLDNSIETIKANVGG
jgi:glycerophosphoryl diester phosphodiesterase